jgi:hypothetical protein
MGGVSLAPGGSGAGAEPDGARDRGGRFWGLDKTTLEWV